MKTRLTLLVVIAALALAPMAIAGGSTVLNGYGTTGSKNVVQVRSASGTNPQQPVAASTGSTLPFTGMDVAALLGVGVVLVGSGLVLRRVGRDNA